MAAAGLQSCHLGRTDIKGVGPPSKGACATTQLAMGFQQGHSQARFGQKSGGSEPGDPSADHEYVLSWLHHGMLAVQGCRV